MKNIILLVVMVLGFNFLAIAQESAPKNQLHGYVEQEMELVGGKAATQTKSFTTFGGKTKVGGYCWAQASSTYSEAYCGPTYQVNSLMQVGVAVGVQRGAKRVQLAGFLWTGKAVRGHMVQNLLLLERGWYRDLAQADVSKRVKLGASFQSFRGARPEVEVKLTNHLSVNAEFGFGKTSSSVVNLRYSF